jgi:hypothetical protein
MPSHSALHLDTILKPLRHAINAHIYEVLGHSLPPLHSNFSHLKLILMRELLQVLLHNLPTVFDGSKVRTVATIEEVFEVILLLPF